MDWQQQEDEVVKTTIRLYYRDEPTDLVMDVPRAEAEAVIRWLKKQQVSYTQFHIEE